MFLLHRAQYHPQPYTTQPQIRTEQCFIVDYRELVWALFWGGRCMAAGSIGLYDYRRLWVPCTRSTSQVSQGRDYVGVVEGPY